MCLRKISVAIIPCLILILMIPAFLDVVALADSGKPAPRKAIIVQPGQEVVVKDTVSGPPPQVAEATGLDAAGGKGLVRNNGTVRAEAGADTTAAFKGASAVTRSGFANGVKGVLHDMPAGDGVNRKNHFGRLPEHRFDASISIKSQLAAS